MTMMFDLLYEEKTGFSAIRNMLKERCLSDMGREHVDEIVFQTDFQTIDKATNETDEFRRILLFDNGFPSQDYIDMRTVLSHLRIEGTFIEQEQLIELSASLHTLIAALQFFQKQRQGKYPALEEFCLDINIDKVIIKKIDAIVDEKGQIRPASSTTNPSQAESPTSNRPKRSTSTMKSATSSTPKNAKSSRY